MIKKIKLTKDKKGYTQWHEKLHKDMDPNNTDAHTIAILILAQKINELIDLVWLSKKEVEK